MAKSQLPLSIRKRIIRAGEFTCVACGLIGFEVSYINKSGRRCYMWHTPLRDIWLSVDHIIPVARGGSDKDGNLRVLCTKCNTQKGTKTDSEWLAHA